MLRAGGRKNKFSKKRGNRVFRYISRNKYGGCCCLGGEVGGKMGYSSVHIHMGRRKKNEKKRKEVKERREKKEIQGCLLD